MKTLGFLGAGLLVLALVGAAVVSPTSSSSDGFTFAHIVPDDVFLYVAHRENPEKAFLDEYWGEVFQALMESGVKDDVIELLSSFTGLLDEQQLAEMERLKEKALRLVDGVDWETLGNKEFVFTELFVPPTRIWENGSPILMANMAWLFRGQGDGAAKNYAGLVDILQAMADEINQVAGSQVLTLEKSTHLGAQVASINLLSQVSTEATLPLSVALRDEIVIIAFREQLFNEILALMDGSGQKKALADDPRFKKAFAQLPAAHDGMTFFDMQGLLNPMLQFVEMIISKANAPGDVYINSGMDQEVNEISGDALTAYQQGDIKRALALLGQAHEAAPENSIVLYNLACFNALAGNKDEALDWLAKAVEGGFYAPQKIGEDSDLESLRNTSKYQAALARATELSLQHSANDVCINFGEESEAVSLRLQVNQTYETNDYERGLELIKQAYAIAPKDSKVLYTLACLHTLLGHEDEGLDFLEKAVEGGFYCPQHMTRDPDLESVRNHDRFKAAVAKAKVMAGKTAVAHEGEKVSLIYRLLDRITNAAGILDCAATVESTDGTRNYCTTTESLSFLVPDAKQRPIYALFGNRQPMTDFDRYLPEETQSFAISGGFDLAGLYGFLEDTFRLAGSTGEEVLAKWAEIQKLIGFDVRKDFIDWFNGDSINITLADGEGSVWMTKVNDEKTAREKISTAITFCSEKITEIASKQPELMMLAMLSMRTVDIDHEGLEGFQSIYFNVSPEPVVWGIADGYLIFGSSADAIAMCLDTGKGKHPNIRNNERAMQEALVPDSPFVSVSWKDKRGMGEEIAAGLGMATMVSGMMGAVISEPEARTLIAKISGMLGKIAPAMRKIDFYKSEASCTTFDGEKWHHRSVTHYFSPAERAVKDK
ncbi:MAG: hypothetical protein KJ645_05605 [Planctomycetes bacterium]|nr:hypothetical protein [Planctomycetota bacterium]